MAKSRSGTRAKSLSDALKILENLKDSKGEFLSEELEGLKNLVSEFFPDFQDAADNFKRKAKEKAENLKEAGEERLKDFDTYVRHEMKHYPFRVLLTAAAGGLLLGFLLGKKS